MRILAAALFVFAATVSLPSAFVVADMGAAGTDGAGADASAAGAPVAGSAGEGASEAASELQREWDRIYFALPEAERAAGFEALAGRSAAHVETFPQSVEVLIWHGVVLSTWAEEVGPLRAVGLVRRGRDLLERSLEIDPEALGGAAHTSLGALYYQVPGFALGFGSKRKAERHLQRALEIAPDSIDPNYFYGDFLMTRRRWEEASSWLRKALAAPDRPGRPLADAVRRREAQQKLDRALAELAERSR